MQPRVDIRTMPEKSPSGLCSPHPIAAWMWKTQTRIGLTDFVFSLDKEEAAITITITISITITITITMWSENTEENDRGPVCAGTMQQQVKLSC